MILNKQSVTFKYININSLKDKKIGIPIFQRKYAWNGNHVQKLLDEILEITTKTEKELYLLDFIYYVEDEKHMIADGQQRLITINLLIKVINDYISEKNSSIPKLKYFDIEYDIKEYNAVYQDIFSDKIKAPFKKMYFTLKKWVDHNQDKLNEIVNALDNNIFIYIKECKSADDAFNIFLQINTGGKPLTKNEVIATAINQYKKIYMVDYNEKEEGIDIKQAITSYYKFTNKNVSKEFDNIEIITFLKEHVVKNKEIFQDFITSLKLLSELKNNPFIYIFKYINRKSLTDILYILAFKKINVLRKREYLEYVIFPLCLLSIVLSFSGGLPSILKSIMNTVIEKIKNDDKPEKISMEISQYIDQNNTSCKINFKDFLLALGSNGKSNDDINKAILLLDNIWSNKTANIDISLVQLEHVYPQKPNADWGSRGGWPGKSEDQKKYIYNIGNQFILNGTVNMKIKNKYITDKEDEYKKIIAEDLALCTEINTIDFQQFASNGMEYIVKRQEKIAKIIYNTFPSAKCLILKSAEN